jgi:hypothetical protein
MSKLKVVELIAEAKVGSGSWGVVGYFTDPERLAEAERGFGDKWILRRRELPLDVILCTEAKAADPREAYIQSAIPGEQHGVNPRGSDILAHLVQTDPVLARKIGQLLDLGFLQGSRR